MAQVSASDPELQLDDLDNRMTDVRATQAYLVAGSRLMSYLCRAQLGVLLPTLTMELQLTSSEQGYLMSRYANGYLATQVLGGILADRLGGYSIMLCCMIASGICCFAAPALMELGSFAFGTAFVALGVLQGMVFPAGSVVCTQWLLPSERSWASSISAIGSAIGLLLCNAAGPPLVAHFGWKAVLYLTGSCCFSYSLAWAALAASSPQNCARASSAELAMLEKAGVLNSGPKKAENSALFPPLAFFTQPCVAVLFLAHFAQNWQQYFLDWLPLFYNTRLGVRPEVAGFHIAVITMVELPARALTKGLPERLLGRGFSLLSCRRLMSLQGFALHSVCACLLAGLLMIQPLTPEGVRAPMAFTAIFGLCKVSQAFHAGGYFANYMDLTRQYSGAIGSNLETTSQLWLSPFAFLSEAISVAMQLTLLNAIFSLAAAGKFHTLSRPLNVDMPLSVNASHTSQALLLSTAASPPKCHDKKVVGSSDDKFLQCPSECPIYADDRADGIDCNFECVEATPKACTAVNPKEPVPDAKRGICRACIIYGCKTCTTEGQDTCAVCESGFKVNAAGKCESTNTYYWYALFAVLGVAALFIVGWIVDIARRPIVNAQGLKGALDARSRSKVRMPKQSGSDEGRELYPLDTNLLKTPVAGIGVQLHFNFQFFLIVWSLAIGLAWLILALSVDDALLILGTRRAKTARQNCILVAWGFETQQRLMWTKIDFVVCAYILTFLGCLAFGVRQLRIFQKVDMQNSTHKDYAARVRNLPLMDGTEPVEEELKKRIEDATGQKVVGVSVCWDFQEYEDELMELIESKLVEKEERLHPAPASEEEQPEPESFFARMERSMLAADAEKVVAKGEMSAEEQEQARRDAAAHPEEEHVEECKEVDVIDILKSIKTCPDAYAIFETETARDTAVEAAVQSGGIEFAGNTITLNASRVEPQTVNWRNCANTDVVVKAKRIGFGFLIMLAGLSLWVVAFYLPYAWFTLTFNYSYGQEPGFVAGMTFSMVVVAGNALMYLVCSEVADRTRFIYVDDREVCYMLLYCFACVFNVALDLITTYMVAYRINVGLRMKTYDGTLLENLQSFSDRFESYAMQRLLANNLYAYAFPATFLIPFLIEPVATIYAPYKMMLAIVRTQPCMKGFMAERLLGSLVFDLSRYADLMLDVMIAVLIFFFPGGFNIQMFVGLAGSHLYIYFFDHYRVLRSIQSCNYADKMVDWWSQWMMCIPCGFMLACVVFKANCQDRYPCVEGDTMIAGCVLAFFGHIVLHTLALKFIVPKLGLYGDSDGADTNTYQDCSKRIPCSWFTANPVYCLRSQYIYKHSPPCTFCLPGKEHLLEVNEDIGLYFNDAPAKEEDYDAPHVDVEAVKANFSELRAKTSESLEQLRGKASGHFEELNKQMTGQFEDLQSKVSGMSAGVSSTFEGMQGKMTGMSAGMSAGMSSTFESLQGKMTGSWFGSKEEKKEEEKKEEDAEADGSAEPSTK